MKVFVLSSGGVDSSTCLAEAVSKYGSENVISATLYYGQKLDREIEGAKKLAKHFGVRHIVEDVSPIMKYANQVCTLIKGSKDVVESTYREQMKENEDGRPSSYVPFRNGLFMSIATAYADSLFPGEECQIYCGTHEDDYAYADCSTEFTDLMSKAINVGTYGKISVVRPLQGLTKAGVVAKGLKLNVPYEFTWSCYNGREKACGKCASCIDRRAAFRANGIEDPIEYED